MDALTKKIVIEIHDGGSRVAFVRYFDKEFKIFSRRSYRPGPASARRAALLLERLGRASSFDNGRNTFDVSRFLVTRKEAPALDSPLAYYSSEVV